MMGRAAVVVLVVASLAGLAGSRVGLERIAGAGSMDRPLLYLPNGRYLKVASMGHGPLLADLLYLWAIQYYSDYERADRHVYVEHVFGEVITELDPNFLDPYWLGALILIVEKRDLETGLALLDRGFERNPEAWILPYLAGWEAFRAGRLRRAAAYFERAAEVPGAPGFVRRMEAGMYAKAGDLTEAVRRWEEVLHDPGSDDAARAVAERQVRDLRVRIDLRNLRRAIAVHRQRTGRHPRDLNELVRRGFVPRIPLDPDGNRYRYDPRDGSVSSPAGRILGGG